MIDLTNEKVKTLCLKLMYEDSEDAVIAILKEQNLWDDLNLWRWYDDNENNWSQVNAQTASPENALVEKLINSVDARLICKCRERGIDPESKESPKSMQEAVSRYFDDDTKNYHYFSGLISEWPKTKRREISRGITLACTGNKPDEGAGYPSFTISDIGEGQTPDNIPKTFLSLSKKNKFNIQFVQGKFNAGGSGVIPFCGSNGLQLIISKRNPVLLADNSCQTDDNWSFTITRRLWPDSDRRSSVIIYLAPINSKTKPHKGEVLNFKSKTLPIFPDNQRPYYRESEYGSLVKLYEYQVKARTHMFRKGGLQEKLDLLLPDIALPIRLHECRTYKGKKGSFELALNGIRTRILDKRNDRNVIAFQDTSNINVDGEKIKITIFAFQKDKAEAYKTNEGILFIFNGQTHGVVKHLFFRKTKIGLSYIYKDLLLIADCSSISPSAFEKLFKNSRDRFSATTFYSAIENELEYLLKHHENLKKYQSERRQQKLKDQLDDSKPLEDVLQNIFKKSPSLSMLFLEGVRAKNPFKPKSVGVDNTEYIGERFPTYFRHKNRNIEDHIIKNCHINMRCRIFFETDATNDYLDRAIEPGSFDLNLIQSGDVQKTEIYSINLHNGIATLNITPPANCKLGDKFEYEAIVMDNKRIDPFINLFAIEAIEEARHSESNKRSRKKPPKDEKGLDRDIPQGIKLPKISEIFESDWGEYEFNRETALRLFDPGKNTGSRKIPDYDWFLNVDNVYLQTEKKYSPLDAQIIHVRFKYGMILIGLGILNDHFGKYHNHSDGIEDENTELKVEDIIAKVSSAVAPILLPMIDSLGGLNEDIFE